jgi:hypothetical protein
MPELTNRPDAGPDAIRIVRFDEVHDPGPGASQPVMGAFPGLAAGTSAGLMRGDAHSALEALRDSNLVVEAITVVRMNCDRPEYVLTTWRCDTGVGESTETYSRRSVYLAEEFLASFPDPGDGTVGYVFMTSATAQDPAV